MRKRSLVAATVALLALAGCNERKATHETLPPAPVTTEPAASAGGACILWDYAFIKQNLGVTFSVAASDEVNDTSTCVVQMVNSDYPDLTLAVVDSTTANATEFLASLKPSKASKLKGLGQAGYQLISAGTADHGPSIEISWLSEANQLQTLIYTFARGAATPTVNIMAQNLFHLAQQMDTTNG